MQLRLLSTVFFDNVVVLRIVSLESFIPIYSGPLICAPASVLDARIFAVNPRDSHSIEMQVASV